MDPPDRIAPDFRYPEVFKKKGCYAQTELGHGSDVQSLETTATYDKASKTFTLNTPTVSATKWWIGELVCG